MICSIEKGAYMKYLLILLFSFSLLLHGATVNAPSFQNNNTVIIQQQPYGPPYYIDPYWPPYQPDNGPMRGPNSIQGHQHRAYRDF